MASLHYKFAAMNAGKSTQLIQAHFNYSERGMRPLALTPAVDNRDRVGFISARVGLKLPAHIFQPQDNLTDLVLQYHQEQALDVVMVDEAQFLTRQQVLELCTLVDDHHIPVMAYGIKTDFQGNLFQGACALLALADKVEEIKSICWCGKKAQMNARIDAHGHMIDEGQQVQIGGNERYVSLCRKHYLKKQTRPQCQKSLVSAV